MNRNSLILAIVILVLLVGGMFVYANLNKKEVTEDQNVNSGTDVSESTPYDAITRIDAKHFYIDGVHTFVGEIPMPTPCDLVEASSTVAESMPEQVSLNFTVINNAEMCAQVITMQRFMVTATASEAANISANLMGRKVDLNLVPAGKDETPESYELYMKG